MVSPGIEPEVQRKMGFQVARTPQEALEQAFAMKGSGATVLVFHHGGEILPIVQGRVKRRQR